MNIVNQKKGISIYTSTGQHFRIKETENGICITTVSGYVGISNRFSKSITVSCEEVEFKKEIKDTKNIIKPCPDCHGNLVKRNGKLGSFLGCSNYPDCRHTEPIIGKYDHCLIIPDIEENYEQLDGSNEDLGDFGHHD